VICVTSSQTNINKTHEIGSQLAVVTSTANGKTQTNVTSTQNRNTQTLNFQTTGIQSKHFH